MTDVHSCSYYCDRPDCIKAQRDELRLRLAQPEQPTKIDIDYWVSSRPQIIEALAKAGFTLMSNANGFWLEPAPQPERHELQAKGEHPAPCARHCEANAFQIVIKNLQAQLAQPEQEPVNGMTKDKALKQVLETLEGMNHEDSIFRGEFDDDIAAIKEALTQPEQEPVVKWDASAPLVVHPHPAFQAAPSQRIWVGLTDEVIWLEYQRFWPFHPAEEPKLAKDIAKFARAIEAKLKEKNT